MQAVASALMVAGPISGIADTSSASRLPCAATAATASSLTRLHSRSDSSCGESESFIFLWSAGEDQLCVAAATAATASSLARLHSRSNSSYV